MKIILFTKDAEDNKMTITNEVDNINYINDMVNQAFTLCDIDPALVEQIIIKDDTIPELQAGIIENPLMLQYILQVIAIIQMNTAILPPQMDVKINLARKIGHTALMSPEMAKLWLFLK